MGNSVGILDKDSKGNHRCIWKWSVIRDHIRGMKTYQGKKVTASVKNRLLDDFERVAKRLTGGVTSYSINAEKMSSFLDKVFWFPFLIFFLFLYYHFFILDFVRSVQLQVRTGLLYRCWLHPTTLNRHDAVSTKATSSRCHFVH